MPLTTQPAGDYCFLPGIAPYSCGVVSRPGFEIVHVTFQQPVPYRRAFARIEEFLAAQQRPQAALCGIELRSPRPYSFSGFADFNAAYAKTLEGWGLLVDGVNPVARTNVAPVLDPPSEPALYGFSVTVNEKTSLALLLSWPRSMIEHDLEGGSMPRKVSDERKRFWRDLVERQPTSGLNIARFCADAGVSQNAFYVWKKRLLTTTQQDRAAIPRRKHRRKKVVAKSLVPVRVIPDVSHQQPIAKAIEIAWPNGIALRVAPGCDTQTLREVFDMLTSAMNGEIVSC